MPERVATVLMFEGTAEEAANRYVELLKGSRIEWTERWAAGEPGPEGQLKRAKLILAGHEVICFNSPIHHAFTFTPATSLWLECESEAELDELYARLLEGGQALMPLGSYGFSTKYGWLNDQYGVSWQLNWQ